MAEKKVLVGDLRIKDVDEWIEIFLFPSGT